jgi:murein DD-endopeptidase MepM/ murein hydrolase activator NlpD
MKLYLAYKKQFNILLFFLLVFVPVFFSFGQTAEEVKNNIDAKNAEIERLEKEIASYQAQLEDLGKQKTSLDGSIKSLDLTRKKLNADINVTQNKIDKTNLTIKNLSKDIGSKEESIENNVEAISLGIKQTNELENETIVENVLSINDFSLIWNDIDNLMTVRERIREQIADLKQVKVELEDTRKENIDAKNELLSLKNKLADQRKIVEQNANEKKKLLAQTKNSEANYQKLVADRLAQKQAFEQELEDFESRLKFILDPSSIPTGRVLSWPLDGTIFVTSPYAPRWGGFHRGTDFRASVGTPVKAVASGVVLGSGNTDLVCPGASFGQWILIEHDNGLASTSAHLSLIRVSRGDRVTRGQVIGYSGNTGSSTGPHLHLSLYVAKDSAGNAGVKVQSLPSKSCLGKILVQPIAATNAYLDPMKYLPPYKKP